MSMMQQFCAKVLEVSSSPSSNAATLSEITEDPDLSLLKHCCQQ